jgi:CelD/BcsL family acetyltransferase involved in cellulose biosynthesis
LFTEARELAGLSGLASIESEWRGLWSRDPRAAPFQSPDWLLPWTEHLWGGGQIRVLSLWHRSHLCALAPFFRWGHGPYFFSFLGSGISDYLDILSDPECSEGAAHAVFDWLAEQRPQTDCFDLQELPRGSPLLAAAEPPWQQEPCAICLAVPLPGSFDTFLSNMDPQLRTNIRRAENRLARAASIKFVTVEQVPGLAESLFRLHSARWGERNDPGVLAAATLQAFHRDVIQRFRASGILRLHGLIADGRPIAVQYNLSAKGRTYAYLSGFDPEWGRFSPGAVLLKHSIQQAIEEGAAEFDFLRKSEAFKYQFGARERINSRLTLSRGAQDAGRLQ